MPCCSKQNLLVAALVLAGLAYYLYMPEVFKVGEEPWKVWSMCIRFKFLTHLGTLGEMLGVGSPAALLRYMTDEDPPYTKNMKKENYTFDGVPVRLYRPVAAKTPSPCVIYIHGGGWTFSSVDSYDQTVSELAATSGYVFVSIQYRLAPENPFPMPFDDCYKATLYLLKHAKDFGIDGKRIGISGDSAGGNLAAAVSLQMSEVKGVPKLRFQWLIYPGTQMIDYRTPSHISNEKALPYVLQSFQALACFCNYVDVPATLENIRAMDENRHVTKKMKQSAYWKYVDYRQLPSRYHSIAENDVQSDDCDEELAKKIEAKLLNPKMAPLMSPSLAKVPPAFIVNAEYDILRDHGLLYAIRLRKEGVEVEEYTAPESRHLFMLFNNFFPRFNHFDVVTEMFVKFAQKQFR